MPLRARAYLALLAAATVGVPAGSAAAGCTSSLPVNDKRLANVQCTGVHPGMGLIVPSKKYGTMRCTAGFAFADQFGNKYLTVPGTCHLDYSCLEDAVIEELPPPLNDLQLPVCLQPAESEEEPLYKRNPPVVTDAENKRVGVIVYAVNKDGANIALIRVDKGLKVDPALPMYGGPVRLGTGALGEEAYAVSAPNGPTPNARSGVLVTSGTWMTHQAEAFTAASWYGAPVMKPDGTGLGYYNGWYNIPFGWVVEPFEPGIDRAARRTKLKFRLQTAKLAS